ncbi:MAG: radical SAM protein [Calditrichaceae bacterium]
MEAYRSSMDIVLVNPGDSRFEQITEHLGIASLKSFVNSRGFKADTLDMAVEALPVQSALDRLFDINPKMVGLSLLDDSKKKGFALAKGLKKSGYKGKIVIGGYFATFNSAEILRDFPEIDFVVRGEGELTLAELMESDFDHNGMGYSQIQGLSYRENGKIIENPARPLIHDLDILPPVDRKYAPEVLKHDKHLRIYGTRGCWGQCSFCDIIGLYGTSPGKVWRRRSAKSLVDEMEQLKAEYGTEYFIFNDDQFLVKGNKSYEIIDEFASEIERRNLDVKFELMCRADTVSKKVMSRLKSVGLQRVFMGLESFDVKQLKRFNKKISVRQNLKAVITLYQLKIDVIASVILADAHTSLWDLLTQFMIIFELKQRYFNSRNCQISVNKKLEIYRGSHVYRDYKAQGLLTKDDYLAGYDFKLRFWTEARLKMLNAEENFFRVMLKPGIFIKSLIWRLKPLKAMLTSMK